MMLNFVTQERFSIPSLCFLFSLLLNIYFLIVSHHLPSGWSCSVLFLKIIIWFESDVDIVILDYDRTRKLHRNVMYYIDTYQNAKIND